MGVGSSNQSNESCCLPFSKKNGRYNKSLQDETMTPKSVDETKVFMVIDNVNPQYSPKNDQNFNSQSQHRVKPRLSISLPPIDDKTNSSHYIPMILENVTGRRDFIEICQLGKGATALVVEALHTPTMTIVALKMMRNKNKHEKDLIKNELEVLRKNTRNIYAPSDVSTLNCENILSMYDAFVDPITGAINLVVEFVNAGSLKTIMDLGGCQDEALLKDISRQLLNGIKFLHDMKKLHRDIKPENVLLTSNGVVKLSDFGLAIDEGAEVDEEEGKGEQIHDMQSNGAQSGGRNEYIGTLRYMSPERIQRKLYSYPSDMWAAGLTILSVFAGGYALGLGDGKANEYWDIVNSICHEVIPLPGSKYSTDFNGFLSSSLRKEPFYRLTAVEGLNHPFLKKTPTSSTSASFSRNSSYKVVPYVTTPTGSQYNSINNLSDDDTSQGGGSTISSLKINTGRHQDSLRCLMIDDVDDEENIANTFDTRIVLTESTLRQHTFSTIRINSKGKKVNTLEKADSSLSDLAAQSIVGTTVNEGDISLYLSDIWKDHMNTVFNCVQKKFNLLEENNNTPELIRKKNLNSEICKDTKSDDIIGANAYSDTSNDEIEMSLDMAEVMRSLSFYGGQGKASYNKSTSHTCFIGDENTIIALPHYRDHIDLWNNLAVQLNCPLDNVLEVATTLSLNCFEIQNPVTPMNTARRK